MIEKIVKVFYCQHCPKKRRKRKFTKSAMERHELSCTANPNRVCKMCEIGQLVQKPMAELLSLFDALNPAGDESVITDIESADQTQQLRDITKGCPACMLAVIRQSPKAIYLNFDWKKESKAFLDPIFEEMKSELRSICGNIQVL